MDITITGGAVLATNDSQPMADPSAVSLPKGKRHTTRTEKVTQEMAIDILEDAILKCQSVGVSIGVSDYYDSGIRCVVVVIGNCIVDSEKHLQLQIATSGNGV